MFVPSESPAQGQYHLCRFYRVRGSWIVRSYQRLLNTLRKRSGFKVNAKLVLQQHDSVAPGRSIFTVDIQNDSESDKCGKCKPDLHPYLSNNCIYIKKGGTPDYDQGWSDCSFDTDTDADYRTDTDADSADKKGAVQHVLIQCPLQTLQTDTTLWTAASQDSKPGPSEHSKKVTAKADGIKTRDKKQVAAEGEGDRQTRGQKKVPADVKDGDAEQSKDSDAEEIKDSGGEQSRPSARGKQVHDSKLMSLR